MQQTKFQQVEKESNCSGIGISAHADAGNGSIKSRSQSVTVAGVFIWGNFD
jgi:hypothetical protein